MIQRANTTRDAQSPSIVWLLGRGRSGTTWLAKAMGLYSRCHYKHEPFLAGKEQRYMRWLDALDAVDAPTQQERFNALIGGCQHQVDFPPFVRKSCRPQSPLLLRLTWQLGKWVRPCRGLYEWYGRPRFTAGDAVLIKDVNFPNELLTKAFAAIRPSAVIATFRNPYGSITATRRFIGRGRAMTREAVARVRELLAMPGHEQLRHFEPGLERMNETQFETLRWRVQSEPLHAFAQGRPEVFVSVYERMCEDPVGRGRRLFEFVGWDFEPQVEAFLQRSSSGASQREASRRHGVQRHSSQTASKWTQELDDQEIAQVNGVLEGSPILHLWPEIFPDAAQAAQRASA